MSIITVTIPFPGGTATMADSTAVAITAQTLALITANEKLWGPPALAIPGSPACLMQVQAQALNDMSSLMASMLESQKDIKNNIALVQGAIAGMTGHVANGVTTMQIAATDQINNNKFSQNTTNAALKRADLPPTEVTPEDLLATTQKTITNVTEFKGQVYAAGLVEGALSTGIAWGVQQGQDLIVKGYMAAGGEKINAGFKKLLQAFSPPAKAQVAETAASLRAIQTLPKGPSAATTPTVIIET
jgi:hypothetical protein